jgi:hypothetical protein
MLIKKSRSNLDLDFLALPPGSFTALEDALLPLATVGTLAAFPLASESPHAPIQPRSLYFPLAVLPSFPLPFSSVSDEFIIAYFAQNCK